MNIESLHIDGFGKFRDYTLEFSEGLNVLYGLNESGKSTIHAFIEGMFYGFIDPTKKRRSFFKDIERYKPRDTASFSGTLRFTHGGKRYRIERNFQKRKGHVKLYNEATGEDITDTLPVHPITKQADLAKFLDMPYMLYRNTLSIRELEAKTKEEASDALIQRLQNLKETSTETFSSKKAKETIEKKLSDIGSQSARTKPYAKTLKHLESLKEEREEALRFHKKSETLRSRLDEVKSAIKEKNTDRDTLERHMEKQRNTIRKERYNTIQDTLDEAKKALEQQGSDVRADVRFLQKSVTDYNSIFKRLDAHKEALRRSRDKIETYKAELPDPASTITPEGFQALKDDMERINAFSRQIKEEALKGKQHAEKLIREDIVTTTGKIERRRKILLSTVISTMLIAIAASLFFGILFYPTGLYSLLSFMVPTVLMGYNTRKLRKRYAELEQLKEENTARQKEIERLEKTNEQARKEIQTLLDKYGEPSVEAFAQRRYRAEGLLENHKRRERYHEAIKAEEAKIREVESEVRPLFKRFGLSLTIDNFETLNRVHEVYETIDDLLEDESYHEFVRSIDFEAPDVDPSDYTENHQTIETMKDAIRSLEKDRFELETELRQKAKDYRNIATIDYEIETTRDKLHTMEKKKRIYENAIDRLEKATNVIEENFAPILSEKIEQYLPVLTGGHYSEIKVRRDLTFKAYSEHTNTLEDHTYFSTGTLDQIYFALRVGILKTLGKDSYPFFLDDAFVNFDRERLNETLRLLSNLAKTHQIIVFTCQEREHTLLQQNDIDHAHQTIENP